MTASFRTAVRFLLLLVPLLTCNILCAQGKVTQYTFVYKVYDYGDTSLRYVRMWTGSTVNEGTSLIWDEDRYVGKRMIPGYAQAKTYVDSGRDSVYYQLRFAPGDLHYTHWSYCGSDAEWDTQKVDGTTTRFVTSINSNRMEVETTTKYDKELQSSSVSPLVNYGRLPGVVSRFSRNGQVRMELARVEKEKVGARGVFPKQIPSQMGVCHTSRELNNLQKEKQVVTTRIFDSVQIHWGENTDHVDVRWRKPSSKATRDAFPYDTVVHFAGGTVVLKRVRLDSLPSHYQYFVELHQQSNGDAYDRTGSIFVIPQGYGPRSFFEGMYQHPDSLPILTGRDGARYQGVVATKDYAPVVELVRFFTPFGVHHFNGRVQLDGLDWADEAYYKQEVTELAPLLRGDVWIGAFIGNYDGGGHRLTLDIKAYPGEEVWTDFKPRETIVPLVNTCNVLEMAGQNYGRIFGTDSLTAEFAVPEGEHAKVTLRYISTGHGGWGGGDEFNPKENEIFIDGKKRFSHTPWRSDCGTYRELNPVSGNFWNGVSSSDYSRSGWCPGTATQPVYFDLTGMESGRHTITVAIPQGKPEEGSFSAWNVSAVLIVEDK